MPGWNEKYMYLFFLRFIRKDDTIIERQFEEDFEACSNDKDTKLITKI